MISSFCIAAGLFIAKKCGAPLSTHITLALSVAFTTAVWVVVTLLTPPTRRETLLGFYRLVRPAGPGWNAIRKETGLGPSPDSLPHAFLGTVLGCALVYAALFGTGSYLYGRVAQAAVCLAVFIASAAGLVWLLPRVLGRARHAAEGNADPEKKCHSAGCIVCAAGAGTRRAGTAQPPRPASPAQPYEPIPPVVAPRRFRRPAGAGISPEGQGSTRRQEKKPPWGGA